MTMPPSERDEPEIEVFALTDRDVFGHESPTRPWRSVASGEEDAPGGPTPAQLRNLKRMHPAYQNRLPRADGASPAPVIAMRISNLG